MAAIKVNLGRVQGAGVFTTTTASGTSVALSTVSPTNIAPLVGDTFVFPNGDVRNVTAVSGDTITCGNVVTNITGPQGPAGSTLVQTAAEWTSQDPVLAAGEFGYDSTNNITKVGDGVSTWTALPFFATNFSFANTTWEQIATLAENGTASKHFSVGDERTIQLSTGEQVTLVILGFNHDDLADGSGKAGITIGMKELLATTYRMNATRTNAGGWNESEMRTSTMATLLSQLPSDLQSVIKQVNKKATAGSPSENITTSADKLWLLALSEIFSATSIENSDNPLIISNADAYNAEGTQYEYYKNLIGDNNGGTSINSLLIRKLSNGSGSERDWFLRSPRVNDSEYFLCIYSTGAGGAKFANFGAGVSFCFCI